MMSALIFALPGNEAFTARLSAHLSGEIGTLATRRFPDCETYVRLDADVAARSVVLVCSLDRPDDKTLRLLFAAHAARDLGAARVGLVAPYLGYMRQDKRFQPGEAITSSSYGQLLSSAVDWMVTVDPHLHRRASMSEVYSIPVAVCHAAPTLSVWIKEHVPDALVVGPDVESEQWVSAVAGGAGVPYVALDKTRHGDRDIELKFPVLHQWQGRTPVLVDDIISSGRTMEAALRQLIGMGFSSPIVLGVHGLFADDAFQRLAAAGAARIISTNTLQHETGHLDVSGIVAGATAQFVE